MNINVPEHDCNVRAIQPAGQHPTWCSQVTGCEHNHTSAPVTGRSSSAGPDGRPELSWHLNAAQRADGSRGMHLTGAMFFSNDIDPERVAGLSCSVDDAERLALDLLDVVAMIRQNAPRPSNVTVLANYSTARDEAR